MSFWKVLPSPKEELCQSDHRVVDHLHEQGPSSSIAQYGRAAGSRKSLGGSKLLPFKNDGGHSVLGDLQCCRHFLVPFPRSVPTQSCRLGALRTIPSTSWLDFFLTFTVNCGTYIDRCVPFQNHVQSIEFTPGCL